MALSIGELVGYLRIDNSGVDEGLSASEQRMRRFQNVGAGIGAAAGAATGAALSSGLESALEFDAANAKMQIQLGGSADYAAEMGQVSGSLFAKGYSDNLGEINDATVAVVKSGALMEDATNEQIEAMTAKAMVLGKTYEQDVGLVAIAAGKMVQNGLADADTAMDVLAKGLGDMGPAGDDLLETFQEYSPLFKALGLDAQTAMGLLKQGAGEGARNLDVAADAIKEFGIKSIDGSKAAAEGYAAIGLNAEQMTAKIAAGGAGAREGFAQVLDGLRGMKDPVAQNTAAVGLFGTKWEDMRDSLLAMDLDTAAQNLGDFGGAADEATQIMEESATQRIQGMRNQLTQLGASLVETQGPVGEFAVVMGALGPGAIEMAGSLAMIGMAFGRAGAAAIAGGARMALGWITAMGPVGWIIAAVVALVALIIMNWDTVVAWTTQAWTAVSGFVTGAWETIKAVVAVAVAAVLGFLTGAWSSAQASTSAAWSAVTSAVGSAVESARATVQSVISDAVGILSRAWSNATSTASTAWNNIVGAVSTGILKVLGFVRGLPGQVLSALGNLGSLLLGAGRSMIDGFLSGLQGAWNRVISWAQGAMSWLRGFWPFSPAKRGPFSGSGYVTHSGAALAGDFAASLAAGTPGIIASARAAMDAARGELSAQMTVPTTALAGPVPGMTPRGGDGASVQVTVNNPLAETASDSINKRARTLAQLGPF